MRFALEVGDQERHTIEFSFNQLFGRAVVKVDGREVFRKNRWFSEPIMDRYEIEIGARDCLRIEKERNQLSLFRSKYKIYINNRLTQLYFGA